MHAPSKIHRVEVQRVFRYFSATRKLGICFAHNPYTKGLDGYSDADCASYSETIQSTTGTIILSNGSPFNWRSVRKSIVPLSSAESEYIEISTIAREVSWTRRLFAELNQARKLMDYQHPSPTPLYVENTANISLAGQEGVTV